MSTGDELASERAKALVGTTLDGRYRIDQVLAMGGMGTVYLARHMKLRKRVALKVLHPDVEEHEDLVLRFEREAAAGAQVAHPGVACATDFGDLDDGTRYLVMEYVRGETLRAVIDRDAPLSVERAVKIARQIAVALEAIHKAGIVHRDLKPRNVMLAENDFVKLVDFGLAKLDAARFSALPEDEAEADARLTGRGVIFGTVEYLAPEAALGMDHVDGRSDLYALGVMLFEMLAGKHPYEANSDAELFTKHRLAKLPRIVERAPSARVTQGLELVVRRLLEKQQNDRFQTAGMLIAELDREAPEGSTPPPEPIEAPPSSKDETSTPLSSERAPDRDEVRRRTQIRRSKLHPKSDREATRDRDRDVDAASANGDAAEAKDAPPSERSRGAPGRASAAPSSRASPSSKPVASSATAGGRRPSTPIVEIREDDEPPSEDQREALVPPSSVREVAPSNPGGSLVPWVAGGVLLVAVAAVFLSKRDEPPAVDPSASVSGASADPARTSTPPTAPASGAELPSANPSPSATASASASAASEPVDVAELAAQVKGWTAKEDFEPAIDAAKNLLAAEPDAASRPDHGPILASLLVAVLEKSHPRADEIWKAVSLSKGGADLIFRWIEGKGDSLQSRKARDMFALPDVQATFSKALIVAFKLRETNSCAEKLGLVDQAIRDGDERAINALDIVARGCVKDPSKIQAGIKTIRKRLSDTKTPAE